MSRDMNFRKINDHSQWSSTKINIRESNNNESFETERESIMSQMSHSFPFSFLFLKIRNTDIHVYKLTEMSNKMNEIPLLSI